MHPVDFGFRRNARPAKTFCCRRIVAAAIFRRVRRGRVRQRARLMPHRQNLPELPRRRKSSALYSGVLENGVLENSV
jgi:hypothetical protein